MELKIEMKNFPKTHYVFVRHVGSYSECMPVWNKLMCWSISTNIKNKLMFWKKNPSILSKETVFFGLCHDDPDKTKDCRYDACFSIKNSDGIQLPQGFEVDEIAEGKYAMVLVKGSYETFYDVYTKLFDGKNIPFEQIDFIKPAVEKYLNSPKNTKPENLLTEIYIPLK